jgi:hypothetical protein
MISILGLPVTSAKEAGGFHASSQKTDGTVPETTFSFSETSGSVGNPPATSEPGLSQCFRLSTQDNFPHQSPVWIPQNAFVNSYKFTNALIEHLLCVSSYSSLWD